MTTHSNQIVCGVIKNAAFVEPLLLLNNRLSHLLVSFHFSFKEDKMKLRDKSRYTKEVSLHVQNFFPT